MPTIKEARGIERPKSTPIRKPVSFLTVSLFWSRTETMLTKQSFRTIRSAENTDSKSPKSQTYTIQEGSSAPQKRGVKSHFSIHKPSAHGEDFSHGAALVYNHLQCSIQA
eukprot:1071531-Amphidinium_carterae.1